MKNNCFRKQPVTDLKLNINEIILSKDDNNSVYLIETAVNP
jgi:hypothetical protein